MITITKERLLTIKQWRETYGPDSNVVLPAEEAEELARIVLASLEAEPVLYQSCTRPTWNSGVPWTEWKERSRECYEDDLRFTDTPDHAGWIYKCRKLYTTPPAPIALEAIENAIEYIRSIAFHIDEDDYHGKHIAYFMRQALAWLEGHSCSDDRLGKADNQPVRGNQAAESNRGNEWTGNPDIDNAIIMLDRIDTAESYDDDRIEAVKAVLRAAFANVTIQPEPVVPDEIEPDDSNTFDYVDGWNACRAAMLQAEPVSNSDELPLDYLQGHKDGLEWAAQLAEANHPQTGDWLYDDPIDLARAIRKGPDMPTVQGGNSPVTPDGWISCSDRMPEMGERQCYVLAADFKNNYPPNIPNTQVGVYGDWFNDGNPTWDDGDGEDLYLKEVTHWMPLPEPPQEVNRG